MISSTSHAIAVYEHMTDVTCQFSAYLIYCEIFSLLFIKILIQFENGCLFIVNHMY